jgi:hypothetical protein
MHDLSVVVATPPGLNAGMLAVEMSLHALLRKNDLVESTQIIRLIHLNQRLELSNEAQVIKGRCVDLFPNAKLALEYSLLDSHAILYWGDFLHNAPYVRAISHEVARALRLPPLEAQRLVRRVLLLEDAPSDLFHRVLSFGSTLLINSGSDRLDDSYFRPFSRFISSCRRIWMRDVISASKVAMVKASFERCSWGGDCAQLITRDDLNYYKPFSAPANWMGCEAGVFFGRTWGRPSDPMIRAAKDLFRRLGYRAFWIPWGCVLAFPTLSNHQQAATEFVTSEQLPTDLAMICALPEFKLIVTDTYHLALLAWTLNVPAILIYSKDRNGDIGVNNGVHFEWKDKRALLFSQYEADEFLVDIDELQSEALWDIRAAHLEAALGNVNLRESVSRNIRTHADCSRAELLAELRECLPRRHLRTSWRKIWRVLAGSRINKY